MEESSSVADTSLLVANGPWEDTDIVGIRSLVVACAQGSIVGDHKLDGDIVQTVVVGLVESRSRMRKCGRADLRAGWG